MNIEIIKKRVKTIRTIYVVSLIVRILCLISIIIQLILISNGIIINNSSIKSLSLSLTIITVKIIITSFCILPLSDIISGAYKSMDDPNKWLNEVQWLFIGTVIFVIITFIVSICLKDKSFAFSMGYTIFGFITFITGGIMAIILNSDIKYEEKVKQYGSEDAYIDALIQESEDKEQRRQEQQAYLAQKKQEQALKQEHEKTLKLIEEIGTKFFVKYYDKLQNWSIPDITDEIEENYSEENKLTRIKKAKKLFALQLNTLALEIISDNENKSTDDNTKEKARQLLEQAKSTDE